MVRTTNPNIVIEKNLDTTPPSWYIHNMTRGLYINRDLDWVPKEDADSFSFEESCKIVGRL